LKDKFNLTLTAKDARERFKLDTTKDDDTSIESNKSPSEEGSQTSGHSLGSKSSDDPIEEKRTNSSPSSVENTPHAIDPHAAIDAGIETVKSVGEVNGIVNAPTGVETVQANLLPLPPLPGMVNGVLPVAKVSPPQYIPSASFDPQQTHLVEKTTPAADTLQYQQFLPPPLPGMVNGVLPIAKVSPPQYIPSASFEPQQTHLVEKTTPAADTLQYQQFLPLPLPGMVNGVLPVAEVSPAPQYIPSALFEPQQTLLVGKTTPAADTLQQYQQFLPHTSSLPCPTYSWRNPCGIPVFLPGSGRKTGIPLGIMPQPLFIKWL